MRTLLILAFLAFPLLSLTQERVPQMIEFKIPASQNLLNFLLREQKNDVKLTEVFDQVGVAIDPGSEIEVSSEFPTINGRLDYGYAQVITAIVVKTQNYSEKEIESFFYGGRAE